MGDIEASPPGGRPQRGAGQHFQPMSLQAVNVSYSVGEQKKMLLQDVSATFAPASLTALMGPSGAGKTTLLNVLAGRGSGEVSGEVLVNGHSATAADYRKLLTVMPQQDIVHAALSVEQALYYVALLRCPAEWSTAQKYQAAEDVMKTLGLDARRSQRIGDENNPGLSGGQRKRVSAAMEFLASRPMLFMDEPTSGLDSATAKSLMTHLSKVARQEGRTVIATIHQPAWAIMALFEQVLLLGKGGVVCYRGVPDGIPRFFASGGEPCPDSENPADHMLYVLAPGEASQRWAEAWKKMERKEGLMIKAEPPGAKLEERAELTFLEIYRVLTMRTMQVYYTDPSQMYTQFKLLIFMTSFLAAQLWDSAYTSSLANGIFFFGLLLYMSSTLQIVIVMPMERSIVLREYRNGMYPTTAYWLSRCTLVVFMAAFQALLAEIIVYPTIGLPDHPRNKIFKWYLASYLYMVALNMFGMCIGIILPSAMVSIKAVPAVMNFWILGSGVMPPHNRMRPAVAWLRIPQPMSYALKIFVITGFDNGQKQAEYVLRDSDMLAINPGNEPSCFWALFICMCVVFCLGFVATSWRLNKIDAAAGSRAAPAGPLKETQMPVSSAENPLSEKLGKEGYGAMEEVNVGSLTPVTVAIRRLSFRHPGAPKKTLQECTCHFGAGTVTALMGPSGAGKTTLLNVIVGRLNGEVTGDVHANGHPIDPWTFRLVSTFTPQDDFMLADFTVRQTLYYTARLRCQGSLSTAEKKNKAEAVIKQLGLTESSDVIVGNELRPGISGGQKKRLSIGLDLLAEKSVMFLDEPTTGLDANAAMTVMQIIRKLGAGTSRTLVATIHQPQWAVLSQFDQLVLIAAGKNIYSGNPSTVADFFAAGGRPRAANENPADHMMFALTEDGAEKWAAQWVLQGARYEPDAPIETRALNIEGSYPITQFEQFCILLERCTFSFVHDEDQGVEFLMPPCFIALLAGLSFYNFGYNQWLASGFLLAAMSLFILVMIGTVLNIPIERTLILREFRNGTYSAEAYWAARAALAMFASVVVAMIQTPIWWTLMDMPPSKLHKAQFVSAVTAAIYGCSGGIVGMLSPDPITASQNTEPITGSIVMFAGVLVPKKHIKNYFLWFYFITPARYALESLISLGFENQGEDAQEILDYFDFKAKHYGRNIFVLFMMLIAVIVLGFAVAKYKIRLGD